MTYTGEASFGPGVGGGGGGGGFGGAGGGGDRGDDGNGDGGNDEGGNGEGGGWTKIHCQLFRCVSSQGGQRALANLILLPQITLHFSSSN